MINHSAISVHKVKYAWCRVSNYPDNVNTLVIAVGIYIMYQFYFSLTLCSLVVKPYDDIDLGHHWLRTYGSCLTVPMHYLLCWFFISEVLLQSSENLIVSAQVISLHNGFQNYIFNVTATSPRGQWVNIAWANVDPDLCCHMASLGHNELTLWMLAKMIN